MFINKFFNYLSRLQKSSSCKVRVRAKFCIVMSGLVFSYLPVAQAAAKYEAHRLAVDGGYMSFYQIGQGMPVVLLHGLFANKEQWLGLIDKLTQVNPNILQHYQFIIPDLAGYGDSKDYPIAVYNIDSEQANQLSQVKTLHDFISQFHLRSPINIAGNSMGGLVMTLYALHYPQQVNSLAFVGSPEGITDFSTEFLNKGLSQGFNPFIPTTVDQFKTLFYLLISNYQENLPDDNYIEHDILPYVKEHYQLFTNIFNMIYIQPYRAALAKHINLTQPTLILWGKEDRVFGESYHAYELAGNLTNSSYIKVIVLDHAGHLILKENLQVLTQAAKTLSAFLQKVAPDNSNKQLTKEELLRQ